MTCKRPLQAYLLAIFLLCTLAAAHASAAPPAQVTPAQIAEGWIALFDGETLFGWNSTDDKVNWHVADGALASSTGPVGFLVTSAAFSDYDLHVEFLAAETSNGGVFLHCEPKPGDPATACYEVNVAPADNAYPTGGIVGRQKAAVADGQLDEANRWHAYDLRVQGGRVQVRLDGQRVVEYDDPAPLRRGHIALQHNQGQIAYRNVRIKPLGMKALLNGTDLTGWNADRAEASQFDVTEEGELRVRNGRGQLESNDRYRDFALQLQCRVDGDGLNSGVFYRCIPRDFMMGYECQISNAMKDNDPTKPLDCGTGGIFRQQDARRIVARDREWFTLTLVVHGPHTAAWVNGYQVSDWTDDRKPNRNPRRGLRLNKGTLAIQGHDPTTDLRFREMNIVVLPKRTGVEKP